jgi:IS1 family transposase
VPVWQVIKTRPNDRIVKVERRAVIGAAWRLEERLRDSEDSSKLNTTFVERLNLTIRQGSAYLFRRTICHARWKERLEDHMELLRCHYNPASYCLTSLCL